MPRRDDVEVGGQRGRRRWTGFETSSAASRRRGGRPARRRVSRSCAGGCSSRLSKRRSSVARDAVARAFFDLYRTQQPGVSARVSRRRTTRSGLKAAYPIHPEIFDRLYNDWSTLVKFQRTRGVLRLMAAVIHSLWEKGDRNPLILPANISIDDPRVQFELTRYLSDNWVPVIEKDVDGPNSLPLRIDGEAAEPRQVCRLPARRRDDLPRVRRPRSAPPTGARRSARQAGLRDARRIAGVSSGRPAPPCRRRHLPLSGRAALLVLDAADGHRSLATTAPSS